MSDEPEVKEGWIVFGSGHGALAVPASVGMKILENFVVMSDSRHILDMAIPMSVMSADAMTILKVRNKIVEKVDNAQIEKNLTLKAMEEEKQKIMYELKAKKISMMEEAMASKANSYDVGKDTKW